jgi:hypothetical protein
VKNNNKKIIKKKNKNNLYGVNEQDFLNVISIITTKLAYKFKFGYHDIDDMKQQITIFAMDRMATRNMAEYLALNPTATITHEIPAIKQNTPLTTLNGPFRESAANNIINKIRPASDA